MTCCTRLSLCEPAEFRREHLRKRVYRALFSAAIRTILSGSAVCRIVLRAVLHLVSIPEFSAGELKLFLLGKKSTDVLYHALVMGFEI